VLIEGAERAGSDLTTNPIGADLPCIGQLPNSIPRTRHVAILNESLARKLNKGVPIRLTRAIPVKFIPADTTGAITQTKIIG
jgi:hypothetical protein